ncbi:MAG: TetR/AcrR family transcriptional regulator [Solirubrobacteraceae bacterium]
MSRPQLSREQIAKAALDYIDRHGLEALSMRRLAEQLGVGTMTLYGYFRSKQELLDGVIDSAVGEPVPAIPSGTWRESIRDLSQAARANLTRHPALVEVRISQPVLRPESLRFAEVGMRVLMDAGFPRDEAARVFRLLFTYTFGFAAFSPDEQSDVARAAARTALSALPADEYPALTSSVDEAAQAMAGDEAFDYGLERILDGIEARLAQLEPSPTATAR